MTITYRSNLNRDLTPQEVDANFQHVLNSANTTFTPSGSGATSRAVSAALSATARSGEWSSTANFNTAQAALTETLGVNTLRVGTGNSNGITIPSLGASPYTMAGQYTLGADAVTIDPQFVIAYNYNRANASDASLHWIMEGHYVDGSGNHLMEMNLDYTSSNGGTQKRFFGLTIDRTTHLAIWSWAGNQVRFESSSNVGELLLEPSLGKITRSVDDGSGGTPVISMALLNSNTNSSAVSPAIQFGAGTSSAAAQVYAKRLAGSGGRLFFRTADTSGSLIDRFEINQTGHMIATGSGTEILLGTGTTVSASGYSGFTASGTTGGLVDLRVNNTSEARMYANSSGGLFIQNTQGRSITLQTGDGTNAQVVITHTASASRTVNLTGSNGGNPTIGVSAGALNLGGGADLQWGKALVALGGGAAPTLGTIGGSGPAAAAQNSWMRVLDSAGNAFWVPAWK